MSLSDDLKTLREFESKPRPPRGPLHVRVDCANPSSEEMRALLLDELENGVMLPQRREALRLVLESERQLRATVAAQRTRLKAASEAFDELAAFLDYALPGDEHVSMLRVALPPATRLEGL